MLYGKSYLLDIFLVLAFSGKGLHEILFLLEMYSMIYIPYGVKHDLFRKRCRNNGLLFFILQKANTTHVYVVSTQVNLSETFHSFQLKMSQDFFTVTVFLTGL